MAGIIDTVKLAGVLVLAIPAALAGLEFLFVRGEALTGGILLVLAVALVAVQRYLTLPGDLPGVLAKRVAGGASDEPDERTD
ncbi:DUF7533 family protein [Natrononativus amylolyticus]|uniref:DUF7533 family protein n=1 Tax=Natrononativus amylolyticus TaxID=2963434 RepID=UPI0020CE5729|nr:hypothetical protein [Natrononativus amylolyticus]